MAKRILNRKDLRADYDAAERHKEDEDRDEDDEAEDEPDDEADDEEEQSGEAEEESDGEEVEAEAKPKKKAEKPAKPRSRSRVSKIVRMRVVWGVFNNSNQCVASYEYPKRKEADDHAARLAADKRSTFFVQPVKEPIEDKKEK